MSSEAQSTSSPKHNLTLSSQDNSTTASAANQTGRSNAIPADQQIKFLVSCIRHSNNGKVDFAEVANECNIISGGAAAKRYQRILRAHNLGRNPPLARTRTHTTTIEAKTKSEKADSGTAAAAHKKRKMAEADTSANEDKDQDYAASPTKKQAVEKESHVKSAVQEEAADIPQSDGAYDMVPMVKGGKSSLSAVKTVPSVYNLDAIYDTIVVAANEEGHRFPDLVLRHSKHL
ncbi:MAG: hypothetical protein LQ345_003139 [Seirophora villosa]|nr:MAG: hypothetical protein LQ345_003139 [Seirophora villosa]